MKAAIDNLKQKPKEQKTAVAGSVAMAVVALLLIGWGFFFLKKLTGAAQSTDAGANQIDFSTLRMPEGDIDSLKNYDAYNDAPFGESRDTLDTIEY